MGQPNRLGSRDARSTGQHIARWLVCHPATEKELQDFQFGNLARWSTWTTPRNGIGASVSSVSTRASHRSGRRRYQQSLATEHLGQICDSAPVVASSYHLWPQDICSPKIISGTTRGLPKWHSGFNQRPLRCGRGLGPLRREDVGRATFHARSSNQQHRFFETDHRRYTARGEKNQTGPNRAANHKIFISRLNRCCLQMRG